MTGCKHTRQTLDAKSQFVVVESAALRCMACEVLHLVGLKLQTDKEKWETFLGAFGITLGRYDGSEYQFEPVRAPWATLVASFDGDDGKFEHLRVIS